MRWDRQNLFVTVGFVMAGFISTYFTAILPGFQMLFVITGFVIARCHCIWGFYFDDIIPTEVDS